jgi:hypothetical protein
MLVLRDDGMILGAQGYDGEPAVIIEWTPDSAELRRREDCALGVVSGVMRRPAKK